ASVDLMHVLREDDVPEDLSIPREHRGRRLVTGGLEPEDEWSGDAGHDAARPAPAAPRPGLEGCRRGPAGCATPGVSVRRRTVTSSGIGTARTPAGAPTTPSGTSRASPGSRFSTRTGSNDTVRRPGSTDPTSERAPRRRTSTTDGSIATVPGEAVPSTRTGTSNSTRSTRSSARTVSATVEGSTEAPESPTVSTATVKVPA